MKGEYRWFLSGYEALFKQALQDTAVPMGDACPHAVFGSWSDIRKDQYFSGSS